MARRGSGPGLRSALRGASGFLLAWLGLAGPAHAVIPGIAPGLAAVLPQVLFFLLPLLALLFSPRAWARLAIGAWRSRLERRLGGGRRPPRSRPHESPGPLPPVPMSPGRGGRATRPREEVRPSWKRRVAVAQPPPGGTCAVTVNARISRGAPSPSTGNGLRPDRRLPGGLQVGKERIGVEESKRRLPDIPGNAGPRDSEANSTWSRRRAHGQGGNSRQPRPSALGSSPQPGKGSRGGRSPRKR